jgi:hypothetical protein
LSRQLAKLSLALRIDLSLESSSTMAAIRTAMSREGFVGATLGDVKQHADLVWVIGNAEHHAPRLPEHFSPTAKVRFLKTFSLGRIVELSLGSVDDAFGDADYVAIVFADDAFDPAEALVAAQWWTNWIVQANKNRRVAQVILDSTQTIRAVAGWTSNETLDRNTTPSDVRFGNADFENASHQKTTLQVGGIDPGEELADAYFPVEIAGIHYSDTVVRGDGAVTLGLAEIPGVAKHQRHRNVFQKLR